MVLNESLNVVLVRDGDLAGEVVTLKEVMEDCHRAIVFGRADEERVRRGLRRAAGAKLRTGDALR